MKNLQTEQALLIWRDGDLIKNQWVLSEADTEISVGRSSDCQIHIPVRWISRIHAILRRQAGEFVIEDAGSKNGVFLNGQRIIDAAPLEDGDVIQLAPGLELVYVDSDATAPLPGPRGMGLQLDPTRREVYIHGRRLDPSLSIQQYLLVETLASQPGRNYSRTEIAEAVWPDESPEGVTDDAIDALVRRTRQRLTEIDPEFEFIVTIRGYGFRLDSGVE